MQAVHTKAATGESPQTVAASVAIDPLMWAVECEEIAEGFTNLLWLTRYSFSFAAVVELVRRCPTAMDDLLPMAETPPTSLLGRVVHAILSMGDNDSIIRQSAVNALKKLTSMPPERRALMEASVCGVLLGVSIARS